MSPDFSFDEFLQFISDQVDYFDRKDTDFTHREHVFARISKVAEEFGELVKEAFINVKACRPEKYYDNTEHLAEEMADTLITVFMLAKTFNIDVKESLRKKAAIVESRRMN